MTATPLTPAEVIAKIAEVAAEVAAGAGVGAVETAGGILSYLHANPDALAPFMASAGGIFDLPAEFWLHGSLSWGAKDGRIITPEYARRARTIADLDKRKDPRHG